MKECKITFDIVLLVADETFGLGSTIADVVLVLRVSFMVPFPYFGWESPLCCEFLTADAETWLFDSDLGKAFADLDWPLVPSFSPSPTQYQQLLFTSPFRLRSITVAMRHVAKVVTNFTAILPIGNFFTGRFTS